MHDGYQTFELTFPSVKFGAKESPWNLNVLLYRGGAATRTNLVQQQLVRGALGKPLIERLALVRAFHSAIQASLESGRSRETAATTFRALRAFFAFADDASLPLSLEHVLNTYLAWCDMLHLRTTLTKSSSNSGKTPRFKPLKKISAFGYGAVVGETIDSILERETFAIRLTRLQAPKQRKTPFGVQAEKQNLEETFAFGHTLQDICDGLPLAVILNGPQSIKIKLRTGQEIVRGNTSSAQYGESAIAAGKQSAVNLRIEAELLMFIGQTGMNLAQVAALELRNFFYVSHLDGYQVKDHKRRRHGVVLFEIYKDYKPHFERYLEWRRELFPKSNKLFPFLRLKESRDDIQVKAERLRSICKELAIAFVSPKMLRNTRVNWLLRQSADPDLTAEMAQHTKQTLLSVYERPSLQRAMIETTKFWEKVDPALKITEAVAPGGCTGEPVTASDIPRNAPQPDCSKPAGCLWCENHRDIDSQDYVWAIASFKYLKIIESSKMRIPAEEFNISPAKLAIDRLNAKLIWYSQSNGLRREWVAEAEARIDEESYHPDFCGEINDTTGGT